MKITRIVSTLAVLFIWTVTNAQITSTTSIVTTDDDPESTVEWVTTTYDFGEIKFNVPVTATFEFTNKSNEPVAILTVKSSCGCTVTDYTKEPVLPNKSSSVGATYNAKKQGVFQKTVTVTMNDNQHYRLILKGTVVNNI